MSLEQRTSILPNPEIKINTPGIFGPDYSFADNIPLPGEIGVRDGDSINDVINAVKGAAFYIDTIGFGESSSGLTRGMNVKPIGVNTWLRTGRTCANGADMWMYNEGIPTGNSLGKRVSQGLKSAGLPAMRGLAPGIIEDAQRALDPVPILGAVFGSGYPSCTFQTLPVGDQNGKIMNEATGNYYIENPKSVVTINGKPHQGRWAYSSDLTQSQWKNTPKIYCPDGYLKTNHMGSVCTGAILNTSIQGFCNEDLSQGQKNLIMLAAAGLGLTIIYMKLKKIF